MSEAAAPVVRLDHVAKTYRAGAIEVAAIRDISLDIPAHRFTTIVGPSGSGKTTLLNLIGCIDTPSAGRIEVCGEAVGRLSDNALADFRARNIGFIFQGFSLVPVLSAYENVEYPLLLVGMKPAERRRRTLEMLEAVGLAAQGGQRPNELSGGQKQRVAIARALVKQPTLVLADEPTANLDSANGAAIIALMRQMQAGQRTTFIFSTHDPQLMSHSEETFVIRDGTLLEHRTEGTPPVAPAGSGAISHPQPEHQTGGAA
jgi:putative ABC transport system ATP-binding protein